MIRLHPVAGDGVLGRHGDLILLCSSAPDAAVDDVLAALTDVAAAGGDGTALADTLAQVAAGRGLDIVAFAPASGSLVVTVFGHAWAIVTTEHGEQRLALANAVQGVRSILPGSVLAIRAGLGDVDTEATLERWSDLGAGTMRAGGLLLAVADDVPPVAALDQPSDDAAPSLAPTGAPVDTEPPPVGLPVDTEPPAAALPDDALPDDALPLEAPDEPLSVEELPVEPPPVEPPQPEPEPSRPPMMPPVSSRDVAVDRSKPFSSVQLFTPDVAADQAARAPLPLAARPVEPSVPDAPITSHAVADDHVEIVGVYCKNGHFDDPAARYCAICGISMAQQTLLPRRGPRPPLGVLVLDDGSIFSLDSDYVVGRDPARDPDVVSGAARPLRIEDPEGLLSRVHARIHLEGWQVQVVDLGSANGTGIWAAHDNVWRRAPARMPMTIEPGTQVGVGRRQMRYESHRNT